MGFAPGDTVVHPQHGAAVVGPIRTKDLGHGPISYCELRVEASSLTILIPADSLDEVGVRPLSSRQDAEAILLLLASDADAPVVWSERNTITVDRMRSRELEQAALVVRDLLHHQRRIGKPLNTGEMASLRSCLTLLSNELSLSLGMSVEDTADLLLSRASGDAEPPG
jgi:CarD family transcriptional regulator